MSEFFAVDFRMKYVEPNYTIDGTRYLTVRCVIANECVEKGSESTSFPHVHK